MSFVKSGRTYGIPYRCLLPQNIENMLIGGRCISVTHKAAASIRVMAACMATGEAAGTAAALAMKEGCYTREIDTDKLRNQIRLQGGIVDPPN